MLNQIASIIKDNVGDDKTIRKHKETLKREIGNERTGKEAKEDSCAFEKISKLQAYGREVCSKLRNLHNDRAMLSQETESLLREVERRREQQNRNAHQKLNPSCALCEIYLEGKKKDSESEESSKSQETLHECCRHSFRDTTEKAFSFHACAFDSSSENVVRSLSERSIFKREENKEGSDEDSSDTEYCELCRAEYSSNQDEKTERNRGGGGEIKVMHICPTSGTPNENVSCECNLCGVRNKKGIRPPCCWETASLVRRGKDEDDEKFLFDETHFSTLSEMEQQCMVIKLREALEKMKNRNYALRKLLKRRGCALSDHVQYCDEKRPCDRVISIEKTRELVTTVKILQNKCRIKDGMIVALANELRQNSTPEIMNRILCNLADPKLESRGVDFDRCTLWKYLVPESEYSYPFDTNNSTFTLIHIRDLTIGLLVLIFVIVSSLLPHYRYAWLFLATILGDFMHEFTEIVEHFYTEGSFSLASFYASVRCSFALLQNIDYVSSSFIAQPFLIVSVSAIIVIYLSIVISRYLYCFCRLPFRTNRATNCC